MGFGCDWEMCLESFVLDRSSGTKQSEQGNTANSLLRSAWWLQLHRFRNEMLTLADQKKHLLIFSLFAIFFYSYYHISLPPASENLTYTQTQSFNVIPNHVVPNFTLIIKVLTFNRLNSLSRCLHSLAAADYLTDIVHLHIYIDHFATHANQSSDSFLEESRRILQFVDGFEWKFGEKLVHYRTGNVGLQAQWLEAWWPTSDHEFAFVVEDDLQVSPLFYKFLRALILNYYYSSSNSTPSHSVYGASLQRPRFVPGKHGNKIHLDSGTRLFLYQLVGTWGQLLFPRPWKEFRLWYDDHKAKGIKPFLDGMVTTGWYKKMGERIWTPWFIKFIQVRGYFNFYTNFPNERALSVSYRDAGVNYRKSVGPDSQLLDESSLDFNSLKMQPLSTLKWYDFCFREVFPGRVIRSMDELGSVLPSVQKQETILLVSVFRASDALTRNLLCHFERQNIWNYILVGLHSDFLLDLARRGHPVVDADQFLDDTRAYKSIEFQGSNPRLTKEVLVKAYVIKKCLEYGYSSWLLDENFLAVNNDLFLEFIDATSDLYAGKSSQLFSVRSSPSVQKIWTDDFLHEVSVMMDRVSLPIDNKTFPNIVAKLLVQKGDVRIKRVDESSIGMEISSRNANASSGVGKKIVYWSAELGLELVHKRLEELGMWVIDSDSSCKAVICHQS